MPDIDIYTSPMCPYCVGAKRLLERKGAAYNEINVMMRPAARRQMTVRAEGGTTVPQIFIGDVHVGGFDELDALDRAGRLDPLLGIGGPI